MKDNLKSPRDRSRSRSRSRRSTSRGREGGSSRRRSTSRERRYSRRDEDWTRGRRRHSRERSPAENFSLSSILKAELSHKEQVKREAERMKKEALVMGVNALKNLLEKRDS